MAKAPVLAAAPDTAAEDRVRAWYKARAAAESASPAPEAKTAETRAPEIKTAQPKAPEAKAAHVDPATTVPPPPKAQALAAAAPVEAPARPVNSSTEDDAAAIHEESRIPSTAPTERVPAPFAHGDLLSASQSVVAAKPRTPTVLPALHGATANVKPDIALADDLMDDSEVGPAANKSATALVGSTANSKLAERPVQAVLAEAPGLQGDLIGPRDMIAPMRGTHAILVHQNQMAVSDGLLRIGSDREMADMQRRRLLVALPDNEAIQPNWKLPLNRRYARPWTVHFLNDLAQAHYAKFHTPLIITSAARTVAFQRHLVLVNGNAAPPTGDVASPHLYGQAIDLAKHTMSTGEIAWLRGWLTPVMADGKIDVEEEFLQSCFHISVYRRYAPQPEQRDTAPADVAPSRRLQQAHAVAPKRRHISTALLAAGLR